MLCANERQRDLWIGGMALHGLLDPDAYARDPTLRSRVMVVPFGLPGDPPPAATGALRGAFPAIGAGDRVLVWGGGVWGWLDPGTAIAAVERLAGAHLVLLGLGRPGLAATGQAAAGAEAVAAARRAGLLGTRVHVNDGWVPYAERGAWLAEADVGVSAHRDGAEARYAHRTRLLDYLWAGLPVVTTSRRRAGGARGARRARRRRRARGRRRLRRGLRADARARGGRRPRADRRRRAGLRWEAVAAPLAAWCAAPPPRRPVQRATVRRAALGQYRWALAETLGDDGPRAAAARVLRRLRRGVR